VSRVRGDVRPPVRPVWNGTANLGELDVAGPAGRIVGMSLHLYDASFGQWRIQWASRSDGVVGEPMVGGFDRLRGEFYNYEPFAGQVALVRFVFSEISERSFRFEQSFSDDHDGMWEPNWIAVFAAWTSRTTDAPTRRGHSCNVPGGSSSALPHGLRRHRPALRRFAELAAADSELAAGLRAARPRQRRGAGRRGRGDHGGSTDAVRIPEPGRRGVI